MKPDTAKEKTKRMDVLLTAINNCYKNKNYEEMAHALENLCFEILPYLKPKENKKIQKGARCV